MEQQITTLHFVPSMLQVFLEEQELEACTCLKRVICSGEALSSNLQERFFTRLCAELHNLYGPTEAAIDVTFWACERESHQQIVPIGRPIANTQLYILDQFLQPVPVGVPGELHIGGVGLARGYLNRPSLTDEKFIANPFSNVPGSRLYKTGDLTRYLPSGNIEYLGRLDHQVKIRSFRIELGEIEALLGQHPTVREIVVIAREDVPGDSGKAEMWFLQIRTFQEKRLVAYVVPHQNQAPTTRELRSFLLEKLPSYMVPSAFVFLEALPLTPNGKVDRRGLPTPELSRSELGEIFVAPGDTLELQLTKIWEEVLGIQPIGVRDNFFELGGHSLLAVRLFAQIEKIFGKNLALTTLLAAPTISQLANILRSWVCDAPVEAVVPLKLGGDKPPIFCIYGILLYQDLARHLDSEQPVYGVYLQDEVDLLQAGKLEQLSVLTSITELASRYLKEILQHQPVGPYFLAGLCFGGAVAFEIATQLHLLGEEVALLALFDTPAPGSMKKLSWHERVSVHLENLSREGSTYALKKVSQKISLILDRLVSVLSRIYRKFDSNSGSPLPALPC